VVSPRLYVRRPRRREFLPETNLPGAPNGLPAANRSPPARIPCPIGDRIGSDYYGFPGFIDQVRLSTGSSNFAAFESSRFPTGLAFVRMESPASLRLAVTNLQRTPLVGAEVSISWTVWREDHKARRAGAGQAGGVDYPLDTSLRADAITLWPA